MNRAERQHFGALTETGISVRDAYKQTKEAEIVGYRNPKNTTRSSNRRDARKAARKTKAGQ